MNHELKIRIPYMEAVISGVKTFELRERSDERNYTVGDILSLREWDDLRMAYTGRVYTVEVTYITNYRPALKEKWVCMSFKPYEPITTEQE